MEPLVNLLPPDCRSRMFLFLTLFDCLRFAETSRTNLEFVILEVDRRRRDQFLVRPCEELTPTGDTILNLSESIRESELPPGDELVSQSNNCNGSENNEGNSALPFVHSALGHDDDKRERPKGTKPRHFWYALPTVEERIKSLLDSSLSRTHPLYKDMENLVLDLKKKKTIVDFQGGKDTSDVHKSDVFQKFSSVTYAHRLHASLLSQCTIKLCPDPYTDHVSNDNESFTVTLERYMGDVLLARCLIGHTYYRGSRSSSCDNTVDADSNNNGGVVVEGGPSFDQWIDHLISFKKRSTLSASTSSNMDDFNEINDGDEIVSTKDWYQFWVFFHSSLLRISPFSVKQAQQLKIGPFSGILDPFDVFSDAYNQPDPDNDNDETTLVGDTTRNNTRGQQQQRPWFLQSRTYACFSPECQDVKLLSERMNQLFRHNNQRIGILETTLNHFGPLGPSFRGRDRVSTEVMLPHKLYVSLLRNSLLSWTLNNRRLQTYMGMNREYIIDLRRWLGDSDNRGVLRWMKLLQDQSQKTRPMTVQPPLVTIRMITLNGIERHLAGVPQN